jgi:hypothetical protein
MMAGAWSLQNSGLVTEEQARVWLDSFDWTESVEQTESDDSQSALQELMGAFVPVLGTRYTVHDLVSRALGEVAEGSSLGGPMAREELRRHGIRIVDNALAISNSSSAIKKMLAGTPFATDPRSAFGRLPGATNNGGRAIRFNGTPERVTTIPLESIGFGVRNIASEEMLF